MKIGIIANTKSRKTAKTLDQFLDLLEKHHIDFVMDEDVRKIPGITRRAHLKFGPKERVIEDADYIISLGGDGTLLNVSRIIGKMEKPILGINIGKLGFLTSAEVNDLESAIESLETQDFVVEHRLVLEAKISSRKGSFHALNDFVIEKGNSTRMITVSSEINGNFLNKYTADGLIVATPTGSTAYSLAANGPILTPNLEAIIINPICPHTLTVRPLVYEADSVLKLQLKEPEEANLTIDGQESINIKSTEEIEINKADYKAHLIRFGRREFFEILRTKLVWGEDVRNSLPY